VKPHLIHTSLRPSESKCQTASQSVQPVWATVYKTVRPVLSDRCPVCLSCLSVMLVYCGQTVGCIRMSLGTEICLGTGDIMLQGDLAHPTERGTAPPPTHYSAHFALARSPISATAELLLHSSRQRVPILYNGPPPFALKIAPSHRDPDPSNTQFLWLTTVTDSPTDRPRYSVCNIGRIYSVCT